MPLSSPKLSRLESLPTELLEQIFLQCLNVDLPLSSLHLGRVLSSTHLKKIIATKIFPGEVVRSGDSVTTCCTTYRLVHLDELSRILWAGNEEDTNKAIDNLQSRILACRWMTWDLSKWCMEEFMVDGLLREFPSRKLLWPKSWSSLARNNDGPNLLSSADGAPVQESIVRQSVREWFDVETKKRISYPFDPRKNVAGLSVASSTLRYSWHQDGYERLIRFSIDPLKGYFDVFVERDSDGGPSDPMSYFAGIWACLEGGIPTKLVHGPWSEDRLSFVCAVSESAPDITRANKAHEETLEMELVKAIKDNNFRAVDAVLNVGNDVKRTCSPEWFHIPPTAEHIAMAVRHNCSVRIVQRLSLKFIDFELSDEDHLAFKFDDSFYDVDEEFNIRGHGPGMQSGTKYLVEKRDRLEQNETSSEQ